MKRNKAATEPNNYILYNNGHYQTTRRQQKQQKEAQREYKKKKKKNTQIKVQRIFRFPTFNSIFFFNDYLNYYTLFFPLFVFYFSFMFILLFFNVSTRLINIIALFMNILYRFYDNRQVTHSVIRFCLS